MEKNAEQKLRIFNLKGILIGILLLLSALCFGQDNLNTKEVIGFSYTTKSFDKVFPFDEPFSVRLIDIPSDIDLVNMTFYEYVPKKNKQEKSADSFIICGNGEWERISSEDKIGGINMVPILKPNKLYRVEIKSGKNPQLTNDQKLALITALKNDDEIQNIINKTAKKYLRELFDISVLSNLGITQEEFESLAKRVVLKVNKNYKVKPINKVQHLQKLATFTTSLKEINEKVNGMLQNKSLVKNVDQNKYEELIEDFQNKLKEINWGKVQDLNDLTTIKNNIFKQFKKPMSKVLIAQQNGIETLIEDILIQRNDWLNEVVINTIVDETYVLSPLNTTYNSDFVKNSKSYISLDLGVAYVGNIDRVLSYSGVNIYLRPVNKNIPLEWYSGWESVKTRTSFLIGITLSSIEEENVRKGLIGKSALVLGVGYRPVTFMKINSGCMVYYKYSNNPLISQDRYKTTLSPFVSLSIDLDAKDLLGGVGNAIFK